MQEIHLFTCNKGSKWRISVYHFHKWLSQFTSFLGSPFPCSAFLWSLVSKQYWNAELLIWANTEPQVCPPPHKQGPSLVSCKVIPDLWGMEILPRKGEGEAESCWEPECKDNFPKGQRWDFTFPQDRGGFEFVSSTTWTNALTTEFMHKREHTVTSRFAVRGDEMNFDSESRTGWETQVWAWWWQRHALKVMLLKSRATYIF